MRKEREFTIVAKWTIFLYLLLCLPLFVFGQTIQISDGPPWSQVSIYSPPIISPDSAMVVYIMDGDTDGKPELYSVPMGGGESIKINKPLPTGFVRDFKVSPVTGTVVYAASRNATSFDVFELWKVPITGGTSIKMNKTLPNDSYDVFEYDVVYDGTREWVVYRTGSSSSGHHKLFSVPLNGTGSQSIEISIHPMVTGGGVNDGWVVLESGDLVVYEADAYDNGTFQWWVVPISGGSSVLSSEPLIVYGPVVSPDGVWVVYDRLLTLYSRGAGLPERAISCRNHSVYPGIVGRKTYSVSNDSRKVVYVTSDEVWSTPIDGSVCLIFKDGFESGTTGGWR